MLSSTKVVASSIVALLIIAAVGVWAGPTLFHSSPAPARAAGAALTYNATANGPYSVKGNTIVGTDGQQYIFHGIGRDGLEYNCAGEGPLDQQHLAYMGSGVNTNSETYWGANTVRLPLSEGFWLHGNPSISCSAPQYQLTVKQVVDELTALKLNVVIDLQWSDAGGQSVQGGAAWAMPDADSVTFWQQVAPIYKGYSNVLFELFNEPHPSGWSCWAAACQITADKSFEVSCQCTNIYNYQSVGMQALVNAVRGTGATNLVLVGGMNWGYDLSALPKYGLKGANIVYSTHPYPYTDKMASTWDAAFGNISATYPVISTESGEYDCGTTYESQLLPYFDAHQIGWMSWAWVTKGSPCTYPQLITDYQGTPAASTGQYIYQYLRSYAPSSNAVNKTWYFAEGRVGAGFKEYLTLNNPDPIVDCAVTLNYLLEGGTPRTKAIAVPHASRITESVNGDLYIPATSVRGTSVSTIATVNANATPGCRGVIVERPMYFSWRGVNSGSDVVGATRLGTNFYFADVPSGAGYTSYLTILNPPGNQVANVTATYYVGGKAVGSAQSIAVQAGTRSTIAPAAAGLPGTHVAAVVTSSQPVIVERPDYFNNVSVGNAQTVSGATSVVGAQNLANDWLFAEGYTGGNFQEYLAIANLDAANRAANVTINVEYSDGTTQTYPVSVNAHDQVLWDVNQNAPAGNISVEVTSTNANIVVEREMFFHYRHTLTTAHGFSVSSAGGTDVIGQQGPANATSYAFAEGFSRNGYNEWLTLQNPTANNETINVVMVNGYGRVYKPASIALQAHSRYTLDVSALVLQNMVRTNDDHRGYEVSMTVQSTSNTAYFVAERPMYWNISDPNVGGSDVIGYVPGA